jgi:hypothetical protein
MKKFIKPRGGTSALADLHLTASTFTVTLHTLKRAFDDVSAISGGISDRDIEDWMLGYSDSSLFSNQQLNNNEVYEAGYAFGYAEDQHPPEEY